MIMDYIICFLWLLEKYVPNEVSKDRFEWSHSVKINDYLIYFSLRLGEINTYQDL